MKFLRYIVMLTRLPRSIPQFIIHKIHFICFVKDLSVRRNTYSLPNKSKYFIVLGRRRKLRKWSYCWYLDIYGAVQKALPVRSTAAAETELERNIYRPFNFSFCSHLLSLSLSLSLSLRIAVCTHLVFDL
jgi:hypothetical protein